MVWHSIFGTVNHLHTGSVIFTSIIIWRSTLCTRRAEKDVVSEDITHVGMFCLWTSVDKICMFSKTFWCWFSENSFNYYVTIINKKFICWSIKIKNVTCYICILILNYFIPYFFFHCSIKFAKWECLTNTTPFKQLQRLYSLYIQIMFRLINYIFNFGAFSQKKIVILQK